jgi:hypothetical protein
LGVKARIKAMVEISFGLGLSLWTVAIVNLVNIFKELLMIDSNAVMACVWCGAAFLPGLVVGFQSKRGIQLLASDSGFPGGTMRVRFPRPAFIP